MARTVSSDPSADCVLASEFMAGAPIEEGPWQRYARSANLALASDGAGCHAQVVWPVLVSAVVAPFTLAGEHMAMRLPLPSTVSGDSTRIEVHVVGEGDVGGAVVTVRGGAVNSLMASINVQTYDGIHPATPAAMTVPQGEIQVVGGQPFVDVMLYFTGDFISLRGVYVTVLEMLRNPSDTWALAALPAGQVTGALGGGNVFPADLDALQAPSPLTSHEMRSALARAQHHSSLQHVKLFFSSIVGSADDIAVERHLPPCGVVSVARVMTPGDTWRLSAYVAKSLTVSDARIFVGHLEDGVDGKPVFREWVRMPIPAGAGMGWESWQFRVPQSAVLFGPSGEPRDLVRLAVYATGAMPGDLIPALQPTVVGAYPGTARADARAEGYMSGDFPAVLALTIWGP